MNYSGSTWLNPASVSDTVRIQALSFASLNIGSEWTPRGNSNWVSGFALDRILATPVIANNSSVTVQILIPSDLPPLPDGTPAPDTIIRLGGDFIDNSDGGYNITFFMPENIASGVYQLRVLLDYSVNPPSGGE